MLPAGCPARSADLGENDPQYVLRRKRPIVDHRQRLRRTKPPRAPPWTGQEIGVAVIIPADFTEHYLVGREGDTAGAESLQRPDR
ncbi:MAG: hypothetical protein MZU84_07015 [Sphingobacterium sp.]|nr:hypothetical protein [Sphingobacterium sp.]